VSYGSWSILRMYRRRKFQGFYRLADAIQHHDFIQSCGQKLGNGYYPARIGSKLACGLHFKIRGIVPVCPLLAKSRRRLCLSSPHRNRRPETPIEAPQGDLRLRSTANHFIEWIGGQIQVIGSKGGLIGWGIAHSFNLKRHVFNRLDCAQSGVGRLPSVPII